jgi:hypothetical protein
MATSPLDGAALAQLFTDARTHYGWDATPVAEADLRQLYDLVKMGPTSANGSPARFIFCHSVEAREKLAACVSVANQPKVQAAPVTAGTPATESHDHGHDHADHAAHGEDDALTLTDQARKTIGLTEGKVTISTFARTIGVPGMVVEQPPLGRLLALDAALGRLRGEGERRPEVVR